MSRTAITIDFEEISASENLKKYDYYRDSSFSIENVSRKILQILDEQKCMSTWFVVGGIAQKYRDLIREISGMGHEIASHSMTHSLFNRIPRQQVEREVVDSKRLLEDITGRAVCGFRTPNFSVTNDALDILIDNGFRYDSSLVFNHISKRVGMIDVEERKGGYYYKSLPIIPIGSLTLGMKSFPLGGGFARLFPRYFLQRSIGRETAAANAFYCHPWEFDRDIPVAGSYRDVNLVRTFVGRKGFFDKFRAACACSSRKTLLSTVADGPGDAGDYATG